jgi:hypothetical protein
MGDNPEAGVLWVCGAGRALKSVVYWVWKLDGGVVDSEREDADVAVAVMVEEI